MSDTPGLVLVSGPEQILAQRAVDTVLTTLRAHDPDVDVVKISAADYEPGALGVHASPSLFGGWTAIVVEDFDEADDALVEDAHALAQDLPDGVTLVVRHKSGNRGKRVLDVLKKSGRVITAPAIKSDRDKVSFVQQEFKAASRQIE